VNFNPAGLGLDVLNAGAFKDNAAINDIVTALSGASSTLRSQASAFGSNLSIVQIRQDFSKNLINVLQTGSSNLTLADTNEEAANSQALSTRQSIAVSALALANQSQQSVLQLLRYTRPQCLRKRRAPARLFLFSRRAGRASRPSPRHRNEEFQPCRSR